eukprot:2370954-Rhodomonas_salina.2
MFSFARAEKAEQVHSNVLSWQAAGERISGPAPAFSTMSPSLPVCSANTQAWYSRQVARVCI